MDMKYHLKRIIMQSMVGNFGYIFHSHSMCFLVIFMHCISQHIQFTYSKKGSLEKQRNIQQFWQHFSFSQLGFGGFNPRLIEY